MLVRQKPKPRGAFHHRRLTSLHSIRVLNLLPSPEFDNPLEATLVEATLDDTSSNERSNSYEALSYVWGSRVGTEPFLCDGKVLLVTPNCECALGHLRQKSNSRTLWVPSAVAINFLNLPGARGYYLNATREILISFSVAARFSRGWALDTRQKESRHAPGS
jgi:hypothetical protein